MEFLFSVAQIVACAVPIAALGAWVTSRGTMGLQGLVSPWRADPWPRGVQEEDPDAPWGHGEPPLVQHEASSAQAAGLEELPAGARDASVPVIARLHGSVHRTH
jgi:hypothetical protein